MSLLQELKDIIKKQRKYASWFEWPDKQIKEKGIIGKLFASMEQSGGCPYYNLRCSKKDPPDCIAEDEGGNLVGIEVTELVYEPAVRLNEKGEKVYALWNKEEVLSGLRQKLLEKDKKSFHGGPFAKLILVIHTAEPEIISEDYFTSLKDHVFPQTSQITESYFLYPYNPNIKRYPFAKLSIKS